MQQFLLQNQRNLDKFAEMEPLLKPIRVVQNIHNLVQAHSGQFKVDGLRVQYIGNGMYEPWTQYIFNNPIAHKQNAKFKIKIVEAKENSIMIGVIDYAKQKDSRSSH